MEGMMLSMISKLWRAYWAAVTRPMSAAEEEEWNTW